MNPQLGTGLKKRHLTMISIGGIIGAGLFVGSGAAISEIGPGVLICYALTGLLVVLVMRMLGEMAAANPDTGSFSAYAERTFGSWAGFSIGWLYWLFWVVLLAVETTAAAVIVHHWLPAVPQWLLALLFMVVLTVTNLFSVGSYGEFEFWFASVKVVAIVGFIVVGVLAIFGVLPGTEAVGMSNLTGQGGFLPHGPGAVMKGMLLMIFSFVGAEIVTIAAAESEEPRKAISRATNSVVWRIGLFYIGSVAVVVTLMPWNAASVATSPYVAVLERIGIPGAATLMSIVVLTAVLSCTNSGLYTASRMGFSLAQRGEAPASWAKVSRRGVPRAAILSSLGAGYVAVFFNYVSPDRIFLFLLNASSAFALFVYIGIACTQLVMRRRLEREAGKDRLPVRMWGYPAITLLCIVWMSAIAIAMLFDTGVRSQIVISSLVTLLIVGAGVVRQRRLVLAGGLGTARIAPAPGEMG